MNNIIFGLGLLLAFVTGFFSAIKSVQLGLRWQIQTKEDKQPTMEVKNPITEIVKSKENIKETQAQSEIIQEWLYGER